MSGYNTNLLSTVYSQSWPAPDPNKHAKRGFHGKIPKQLAWKNKIINSMTGSPRHQQKLISGRPDCQGQRGKTMWVTQGRPSPSEVYQRSLTSSPSRHAGLDEGTYKWKSWTNYKQDSEGNKNDLTLYKITQDTFRKLSEQVHEVNQQIRKYHSNGFKSYYDGDGPIRPTQLTASLPRQTPSINSTRSRMVDDMVTKSSEMALQCRSVQRSTRRRPHSHSVTSRKRHQLPQRPHSTTALNGRQATGVFDQLTPQMMGALGSGKQPNINAFHPGPFDIVTNKGKPEVVGDEDSDDSDDKSVHVYRIRTPANFELPPEDLDVDDYRGKFQYRSSSAGKRKQEPYPEPLSEPYCYMDLLELSLLKEDWRHAVRSVPIGVEEQMIDRLIEMEHLQTASTEWERGQRSTGLPRRAASAMQIRKGWNSSAAVPTERVQSALARPKQSKNCSPECLQPLCAGECEMKVKRENSSGCPRCRQEHCQGLCTEYGYHLHIRQPRQEEEDPHPTRPNSCKSCTGRTSSTRKSTLNANTSFLGRPKSAFATFSSAKQQSRKPLKISAVATSVSDKMAKLGLSSAIDAAGDCPQRPKTASGTSSGSKHHGRNAMLPGKSFTSQRQNSLTDEPISTSAAKMNPKQMRIKSARLKARQSKNNKK